MTGNVGQVEPEVVVLCNALYPRLYGALALYTGDADLAEELTQEVMLRIFRSWATVAELDRPDRWALRVGINLAKSRWRRRKLERSVNSRLRVAAPITVDHANTFAIRTAVAQLPERQRAAIVLRYFNDLSIADTARILDCAEGTVKALTSQAVAGLRIALRTDVELTEEVDQ